MMLRPLSSKGLNAVPCSSNAPDTGEIDYLSLDVLANRSPLVKSTFFRPPSSDRYADFSGSEGSLTGLAMQTMLATIVDADGDILCEKITVRTHMPVRPNDPSWCGSFRLDREPARPPEADDMIWLRIPTGEELPAVIVGCCLNDVYFHSRCRQPAQEQVS